MSRPSARRRRSFPLAGTLAALVGWAAPSTADLELGPLVVSGEAQLGGREVTGDRLGDNGSSQFDKYRDIRSGIFGSGRFLVEDQERRYYLRLWLDDVAEKDQEYRLEVGRYGFWGLSGSFSEIPQFYSKQSLTPYQGISSGKLTLPAGFDRDIDLAAPGGAQAFDDEMSAFSRPRNLRFRTYDGQVETYYKPAPDWDLRAGYRILDKNGRRPEAMKFGFGQFVHFPAPVDEVIHEATAGVQLARDRWNLGLNYTGNFFDNQKKSISIENPLRSTPVDGTSDVGRMAAAPDNWAQHVSLSGATLLPTSFAARLAGTFTYGLRRQDQSFIPMTSNGALAGDPGLDLPQNSLDGWVQTILGNIVLTSQLSENLDLEARYRVYDYDNDSDRIQFTSAVVSDQTVTDREIRSIANSYRKMNADVELSRTLGERTTGGLGFLWEYWRRSNDRERRNLHEYGPTARIDHRASWVQLHGSYAWTARRGTGYQVDPLPFPLKKYPQASRLRHRFHLLSQFTPRDDLEFSLSGGFSLDDYDNSKFGLRDDQRYDLGADASYQPLAWLGFSAFYTYDWIYLRQRSETGTPPENWTGKTRDRAHNGGLEMDVALVPGRLDWTTGYVIQYGRARSNAKGGGGENYPSIEDTLQGVTTAFRFYFNEHVEFDVGYRYEDYDQKDFQFDQLGLTNFSSFVQGTQVTGEGDVFLNNPVDDYHAHIISVSAIVRF